MNWLRAPAPVPASGVVKVTLRFLKTILYAAKQTLKTDNFFRPRLVRGFLNLQYFLVFLKSKFKDGSGSTQKDRLRLSPA